MSPESTIFDVVSMVSRQDVTRLTDPNSLYALAVALAVKRDTTVRLRWTPQRRRLTDRPTLLRWSPWRRRWCSEVTYFSATVQMNCSGGSGSHIKKHQGVVLPTAPIHQPAGRYCDTRLSENSKCANFTTIKARKIARTTGPQEPIEGP